MNLTRRSMLKMFGGVAVGAIASPLPWKLLDDASIWTQNWSLIPHPPRGEVTWRHTTCTLCPAGCGLRVRCVGNQAVSAWPVANHPRSLGTTCPVGFAAAQMPFHPTRVAGAARRDAATPGAPWRLTEIDGALDEVGRRLAALRTTPEQVAVLDLRPGRALSLQYREFLGNVGGGRYLVLPDAHAAAAATLDDFLATPAGLPGYDLARARAVVSFGAPLWEGSHGAAAIAALRGNDKPYLIQADPDASLTASRADTWLCCRPGTEAALALGLAHVLVHEAGFAAPPEWHDALAEHDPDRVGATTDLAPAAIRAAARELAGRRPALAVGGGNPAAGPLGREEEQAIWLLNLVLQSVGGQGPVTLQPDLAAQFGEPVVATAALGDVPDGSLALLLVDGSLPAAPVSHALLRRKLRPDGLLVGLSAYAGGPTALADVILPAAAPGEWLDDVPAPALAPRASWSWAAPIAAPPAWAFHPAELLDRLAAAAGTAGVGGSDRHRLLLANRAAAVHAGARGTVFDAARDTQVEVTTLISGDGLAELLQRGGCWTADHGLTLDALTLRPLGADGQLAATWRVAAAGRLGADATGSRVVLALGGAPQGGVLPPVVNKLYRESGLRAGARCVVVNPETARQLGLRDQGRARLQTERGSLAVMVVLDGSVRPGLAHMTAGAQPLDLGDPDDGATDILDLCGASQRPVWRLTRADLQEV